MTDMNMPKIATSNEAVAQVAQPTQDQRICDLVAAHKDIELMTPYQIAALALDIRASYDRIAQPQAAYLSQAENVTPLSTNRDVAFMMMPKAERERLVRESVKDDHVVCLCCGGKFKMLKRHLGAEHGLTEMAYRERFGLSDEHPITAPAYSARKANYAKKVGFGKYSRHAAEN